MFLKKIFKNVDRKIYINYTCIKFFTFFVLLKNIRKIGNQIKIVQKNSY